MPPNLPPNVQTIRYLESHVYNGEKKFGTGQRYGKGWWAEGGIGGLTVSTIDEFARNVVYCIGKGIIICLSGKETVKDVVGM